jgi:DNA topoisomerase-1
MARVDNAGVAAHIASILSVKRRTPEEFEKGAAAEPENPRCEKCGDWSVLIRGSHGLFFGCASRCGWTQDVNSARRSRSAASATRPHVAKPAKPKAELTDIACEKCGKPMAIRSSARGQFLGCSGYPECRNATPLPPELAATQPAASPAAVENPLSEEKCPKCGLPLLVRSGRFGKFLACSAYPKCKTTKKI